MMPQLRNGMLSSIGRDSTYILLTTLPALIYWFVCLTDFVKRQRRARSTTRQRCEPELVWLALSFDLILATYLHD